jgi:hypothetical protein
MDKVFSYCYIHIDIIFFSASTTKKHKEHLNVWCFSVYKHMIKTPHKKMQVLLWLHQILGHMIYLKGLKVWQTKVDVITHIPRFTNASQV